MDKGTAFDLWWGAQEQKPAVQKGTLRRGWDLGAAAERARLRPLLEQCLDEVLRHLEPTCCNHQSQVAVNRAEDILADLRRELGKEG